MAIPGIIVNDGYTIVYTEKHASKTPCYVCIVMSKQISVCSHYFSVRASAIMMELMIFPQRFLLITESLLFNFVKLYISFTKVPSICSTSYNCEPAYVVLLCKASFSLFKDVSLSIFLPDTILLICIKGLKSTNSIKATINISNSNC